MDSHLYRGAVFALYQFTLLIGIVMLPFALLAERVGVSLPVHRAVSRLGEAYDEVTASSG